MADELNQQKNFLTWEESAAVLETDARQGMARAQRLLSTRYLRGRGAPKDEVIAFYWMQLAAQQNYATAQRSLGELYENGSGIALDITIASHWYGARSTARRFHRQKTFATLSTAKHVILKKQLIHATRPHDHQDNYHC